MFTGSTSKATTEWEECHLFTLTWVCVNILCVQNINYYFVPITKIYCKYCIGFYLHFQFVSGFEASLTLICVYTCREHNKRNTGFYFLHSLSPEYLHFAHKFLRADSLRLCSNQRGDHTSWHRTGSLPFPVQIYCHFPSSAQSHDETHFLVERTRKKNNSMEDLSHPRGFALPKKKRPVTVNQQNRRPRAPKL